MLCRTKLIGCAAVGLAAVALVGAQVALAVFDKAASGGPQTVATSTMSPAKGVSATEVNCRINKAPEVEVAWTATSSGYAASYSVERATTSSGPYTALASVKSAESSYLDKSALGYSTTYYYRVAAVYRSWSASSAAVSVKTLSKSCL